MRRGTAAWLGITLLAAEPGAAAREAAVPAAPVVFTPMDERSAAFSPDGRMVAFSVRIADYRQVIAISTLGPKGWSRPVVAPFSGSSLDSDPAFSPDGKRLYFASDRGPNGTSKDTDIWQVDRTGRGWGKAVPVPGLVNSQASESGPSPVASGRLYFTSSRTGSGDIYVADPRPKGFAEPTKLGPEVNGDQPDVSLAVDPHEKLLIFASIGREDEVFPPGVPYPKADLYVSRRTASGWSTARKLGPAVNSLAAEAAPRFSADGKSLIFMSERNPAASHDVLLTPAALHRMLSTPWNGLGNIYRISLRALGLSL